MAGLYGRAAARGFPAPASQSDTAEVVYATALADQGGTADPAHSANRWGPPTSTLPGFMPEGPPPPQLEVLGDIPGPGGPQDPSQSPGYGPGTFRTHAAPRPGHVGSYLDVDAIAALQERSREIHGISFGNRTLADFAPLQSPGGDVLPMDPAGTEDYGASNQAPLSGAQRVLGGYDGVQGYGGGGSGPGGVNGYGYGAVLARHQNISGNVVNAYLDPAERPFLVPQGSGSYIPTDAVTGPEPFASYLAADGTVWHDPSAYAPAPQPATLSAPLVSAQAWGW